MTNKSGPSIYIPSDKNIYDALQHKKIGHSEVLRFLRNRGIIVSKSLDKGDLSRLIAGLTFDYSDYLHITKLLENPNRKDKTTKTTVKATSDNDQLAKICQQLSRSASEDESYKVIKRENSTILEVTYTDVDFTKTELRQRTVKKCEIELHAIGDEVSFRMPATKKGQEVSKKIQSSLAKAIGKELEEEAISLENITAPDARSLFFDQLIKTIPGYKLDTVSSVNIYNEVDNLDEIHDDDDSTPDYAVYIKKAALAGGGVLDSAEFSQMHSRGFFIGKIIWTVIDKDLGGDKVELEAQFGKPSSCTDFKYLVRKIYSYNERTRDHNKSCRPPSRLETDVMNKGLETAAKMSFDKILSSYVGVDNEND